MSADLPPSSPHRSESPGCLRKAAWRYLLVDQGVIAIFVNFAINWGIAWAVFRSLPVVPLRGERSMIGDTIATCWMLPLISCLIVTALTRQEVRRGRIGGFPEWHFPSPTLRFLLRNLFLRALFWGLIGRVIIAPVAVLGLQHSGIDSLPLYWFLFWKGAFASVLGIVFCPLHAWWALHDPVSRTPP